MTTNQILKLAKHLKSLAEKLDEEGRDWTDFVIGDLTGIAEMLELQVENTNKENK